MGSRRTLTPIGAEIEELHESYSFPGGRDSARIASILRSNGKAVAILKEAVPLLRALFGPEADLRLELDRDPESGWVEIFATVGSHHSAEEGLDLLRRFDRKWWLGQVRNVAGKLNFTWEPRV